MSRIAPACAFASILPSFRLPVRSRWRLNVADPVCAGQFGKAAFDAVGPLLLIGWAEVGPSLLAAIHEVHDHSQEVVGPVTGWEKGRGEVTAPRTAVNNAAGQSGEAKNALVMSSRRTRWLPRRADWMPSIGSSTSDRFQRRRCGDNCVSGRSVLVRWPASCGVAVSRNLQL
jgi:hypothetical protein